MQEASAQRVHPQTRAEWRAWLAEHAAGMPGVWLVSWRKGAGRGGLPYEEAVEEALCFGWVDSRAGKLDDERTMLWFSPRTRRSAWARSNKQRVERLLAAGLMTEAGLAAVEQAKRDGTWTLLDEVEDLVVPADLAAAFADRPPAQQNWDGFSRSVRRSALVWIVEARQEQTRRRRVQETAEKAQRGERPR